MNKLFLFLLLFFSSSILEAKAQIYITGNHNKTLLEEIAFSVDTEENTMIAKSTFALDFVEALQSLTLELQLSTDNLLKSPWHMAEPDSESPTYSDPEMIPDMCFIPGTTRFIKATLSFSF
jgi:hypothetical protein